MVSGESMREVQLPTCPRCARALPQGAESCAQCGAVLRSRASPGAVPKGTPATVFARPAGVARSPSPSPWPALAPRNPLDSLVGSVVAGRFQIEELIGQGGMGKVYRARHLTLDKPVCLKMLKPALLEDPTLVGRFEREAKAASRLNHPNSIA